MLLSAQALECAHISLPGQLNCHNCKWGGPLGLSNQNPDKKVQTQHRNATACCFSAAAGAQQNLGSGACRTRYAAAAWHDHMLMMLMQGTPCFTHLLRPDHCRCTLHPVTPQQQHQLHPQTPTAPPSLPLCPRPKPHPSPKPRKHYFFTARCRAAWQMAPQTAR